MPICQTKKCRIKPIFQVKQQFQTNSLNLSDNSKSFNFFNHNFDFINNLQNKMQKPILCPKEFIKNKQTFQEYLCNICYQICVRPARCLGPCKKIFCLKCVSESRISNDRCPLRCSSPFEVQILPWLSIQFECPYDQKHCHLGISSLQQFNEHYKTCKYVPQQEIYLKKMKKQFKCLKNHQLQFFIGSFEEMCNSQCSLCHQKKLCRAICRQCQNSLFCVDCRTPPCKKGKCPIGHQMKLWRSSNLAYICDICGISTAISNSNVYDDTECNFGICQQCFGTITKKQEENIPNIKLESNKNDQCDKNHKLTICTQQNLKNECSKCKKAKQCLKQCKECEKKYCLSCKIATIQGDQTCPQNHPFARVSTQTINPDAQFKFQCMKCQKNTPMVYYDKICRIKLCQQCFVYGIILASQKQRFVQNVTCKKNHVLRYMNNPELHEGFCTLCKRKMPAKLYCDFCQIKQQFYCCACKPLSKFQTCYFGHKLLNIPAPEGQVCVLCNQKQSQLIGCKQCSFYICNKCQDQFDSSKSFTDLQSWMVDQSQEICQFNKS